MDQVIIAPPVAPQPVVTHASTFVPKKPIKPHVRRNWGRITRDTALALFVPTAFVFVLGMLQLLLPTRVYSQDTPDKHGLAFEDVRLTTTDGMHLAAWYVPAVKQPADGSAILILHGSPEDKGDILARTEFLSDHHALLYVDFRYFGGSEGKFTTAGLRETNDALAGIAYLKERGAKSIGVYGFTLGGAVALTLTDRTTDLAAVVAEAPYATFRVVAEVPFARLGPAKAPFVSAAVAAMRLFTGVDADESSPLMAAARSRVPTLLIHSRTDQVMPFRNAEELQGAMKTNPAAEFLFFDDQAHGAASAEFAARAGAFFDKHLNPKTP